MALAINNYPAEMNKNFIVTLDLISKLFNIAFKFGAAVGGGVLLFYCMRIGYVPKGVNIGDGLILILLAVSFGGLYLFFVLSLTSLGILMHPIWSALQRVFLFLFKIYTKVTNRTIRYMPFEIEKGDFSVFVFALFGILFVYEYGKSDIKTLLTLLLSAWGCALLWTSFRKSLSETSTIVFKKETDKSSENYSYSFQSILLAAIIFLPLLVSGVSGRLLDGAMRLVRIRIDNAVVHVKQPYVDYAKEFGVIGKKSNLGKNFSKFENAVILFNGVGRFVVLELHGKDDVLKKLIIPSENVFIING